MSNNIVYFLEGRACPSGTCSGTIRYIKWVPVIYIGKEDDATFTFKCTDESCDLRIEVTIPESQIGDW